MYTRFAKDYRNSLIVALVIFLLPLLFFSHYMIRFCFMCFTGLLAIKFVYYRWEQFTSAYAHQTVTDLDMLANVAANRVQNKGLDMARKDAAGLSRRTTRLSAAAAAADMSAI